MKGKRGFTFIEILMTMVIATILVSMGVFTMGSYMPKQRLLDSLETMEQTLSRAQFEATSRSTWSCIKYNSTTKYLSIYVDTNGNHAAVNGCGDTPDILITNQQIRNGVSFATCTGVGTDSSFTFGSPVWFDSAGVPKLCSPTCATKTFQIVLSNSDLKPGNKAREVEAITSGLIAIAPRGEKGYTDTIFAKTPLLSGTGSCE